MYVYVITCITVLKYFNDCSCIFHSRVIVSLLDNFHYTVSEPAPADSSVVVVTPVLEDGDEEVIEPVAEDDVKGKRLAERIYVTLMKQILPMLESNLIVNVSSKQKL